MLLSNLLHGVLEAFAQLPSGHTVAGLLDLQHHRSACKHVFRGGQRTCKRNDYLQLTDAVLSIVNCFQTCVHPNFLPSLQFTCHELTFASGADGGSIRFRTVH